MASSPGESLPDNRRQLHRLGVAYLLDTAHAVAAYVDRDLTTALVFLAILRANVGVLTAAPVLSEPYAGEQDIPPDTLRQPVSVYAVSRDLGLPYETVRRHAKKLKDSGRCIQVKDGLIIPARVLAQDGMIEVVRDTLRRTTAFVAEAAMSGYEARAVPQVTLTDGARQVSRLSIDYFLDGLKLLGGRGDLDVLAVLVVRTVTSQNVRRVTHDPDLTRIYSGEANIPPDEVREPITVFAVAKLLMLPYETARRTCMKLVERGILERVGRQGLIVPTAMVGRRGVVANAMEHAAMTADYLERLAEVGVVALPRGVL